MVLRTKSILANTFYCNLVLLSMALGKFWPNPETYSGFFVEKNFYSGQNCSHYWKEVCLMSRKGESIFKRKDGRWEGRYIKSRNQQGKAIYGYVYGSSYGKAKEKLRQRAAGLELAPQTILEPVSVTMTFGALSETWLSSRHTNVKESTYIKYRNLLNKYIIPQLGAIMAVQITVDTLNEYYNWLLSEGGEKKQGLSPKTISDVFSVVRSVLRYARLQKIPVSCTGTEISIRALHRELCILSTDEQAQLVEYLAARPSERNLGILLCLYTGIRLGEVCALR